MVEKIDFYGIRIKFADDISLWYLIMPISVLVVVLLAVLL